MLLRRRSCSQTTVGVAAAQVTRITCKEWLSRSMVYNLLLFSVVKGSSIFSIAILLDECRAVALSQC